MRTFSAGQVDQAATLLRGGGLLAYPTEAVFGLGCDPLNEEAVARLYRLKQRGPAQGFLLIASSEEQLSSFVDWSALSEQRIASIRGTWPGPVTWILPRRALQAPCVMGSHHGIAVRVTAHPVASALCTAFGGAVVSTSANPHGREAAKSTVAVSEYFENADLDATLDGPVGGAAGPSEIRDALTGAVVRHPTGK